MRQRWEDGFNCILGIWLFFSPWVLSYGFIQLAAWNAYIIGGAYVLWFCADCYGIWRSAVARA